MARRGNWGPMASIARGGAKGKGFSGKLGGDGLGKLARSGETTGQHAESGRAGGASVPAALKGAGKRGDQASEASVDASGVAAAMTNQKMQKVPAKNPDAPMSAKPGTHPPGFTA